MDYSLTGEDVQNILKLNGINAKVLTYTDIANMKSIEELLPVSVICFLTKKNYGHWICIFNNHEGIQFFDSYGYCVDDEQKWKFSEKFKREAKEDYPYLTRLLYKYTTHSQMEFAPFVFTRTKQINYNPYKFQGPGTSTCGRHCIIRICCRNLSCDEYKAIIDKCCSKLNLTADQLSVVLSSPQLKAVKLNQRH